MHTTRHRTWRLTNAQKRLQKTSRLNYSSPSIGLIIKLTHVRNNILVHFTTWNPWRSK